MILEQYFHIEKFHQRISANCFIGKDCLSWSPLIWIILNSKGKLSHLLGTGPKAGDSTFDVWDEEDSMTLA